MRADPWSRERVALLQKLWTEGATAQAIADRLGDVSRAAVLGKIFRLRLDGGAPAPVAKQTSRASDAKRDDAIAPGRRKSGRKGSDKRGGQRDASPDRSTSQRTRGKSLFDLANDSCRWPYGRPGSARFHFCGAPGADLEGGMPYCSQHAARAYVRHPSISEGATASVARTADLPDRAAGQRRYVWRGAVRHPAVRWK